VSALSLKVVIRVADLERARAFWVNILDLPESESRTGHEGPGCVLRTAAGSVELQQMSATDPRYHLEFSQPSSSDKIEIRLQTHDLEAWVSRLRGHWPFEGPFELPWGHRAITLRDPDGVLVVLYEDARLS
jgi:catechol 2,3-dioxygenase-like lactoylglutathione lyase family enzyme